MEIIEDGVDFVIVKMKRDEYEKILRATKKTQVN